jgi:hypothetical protein
MVVKLSSPEKAEASIVSTALIYLAAKENYLKKDNKNERLPHELKLYCKTLYPPNVTVSKLGQLVKA